LLSAWNTPYRQRHTQTESERMEKDIPSKWNLEGSLSTYTN
jgi:hypothetical protein